MGSNDGSAFIVLDLPPTTLILGVEVETPYYVKKYFRLDLPQNMGQIAFDSRLKVWWGGGSYATACM